MELELLTGFTDNHIHTGVSRDCKETVSSCCQAAVRRDLTEIVFTNHVMLKYPDYLMTDTQLLREWQEIQIQQALYPGLCIRLGLELDYYAGMEHELQSLITRYEDVIERPFDCILGSVHALGGVLFSSEQGAFELLQTHTIEDVFREYFRLNRMAAESGLFTVIAHPDLVKKYTHQLHPPVPIAVYTQERYAFLETIIKHNITLEINTKGRYMPVGEMYPARGMLAEYVQLCGAKDARPAVVLSSDAHRARDIGRDFHLAANYLRSVGINEFVRFERREAIYELLPDPAPSGAAQIQANSHVSV